MGMDLEKAYDRVPREELWYCMRKSGVAEKYVRVVQDMYERSRTVVRCAVGQTEEFNVEVGLHQGSALSPFLFAIVMDQLSEEVRQESPWTMMFADDIVICSESREQVEENLERWRFALERRGMKVSRSKTEYMCVNEREGSGTVRLQGEEVKKVQEFKYLGSTVQSNGECGKEVKKRVQAGWNGWRKVSGVLCDRKISARIKGKVYRTVVRPAMLYGLETVSLRKRQESELEVAELKMLRFSLGVTRLDRIRNEYIRGTAHVGRLGDKVREARLRWFGHVQRRENTHSLQYLYTAVTPGINFPEFTAVGLVDGEQVVYYDRNIRKMIPKTEWIKKIDVDDPDYWNSETDRQQGEQDTFKSYLSSIMKSFNQAEGLQRTPHRPKKLSPKAQPVMGQTKSGSRPFMEIKPRTVTSPGLASPGPHPGARPRVGACRRAPGGQVFACGTRPGTARRKDVGPPSRRPTTCRKENKGPVLCVLGSSHGWGPQRPKPWTKNLAFGTWNVTSLGGKEPELVREVERYRLEIVGLASTHSLGSGTQLLERGWTLLFSGVPHDERRRAGVGLLIAPQLSRHVLEFSPVNKRVVSLCLRAGDRCLTVVLAYGPNGSVDYPTFLEILRGVLEGAPTGDSIVLLGDCNAHVGNDSDTWRSVIGRNGPPI
ncbi:hypothetical protein QTP86_002335 [Hemibagrus guttatus]|nr:hypothetical protein QTP86_002335 [Hemibagrus guttatus]